MPHHATFRRPALWVAAAYVLALALIAFWPTPVDRGIDHTLFRILDWLHHHGTPHWVDYTLVEFSSNVVLFIPLGLLFVLIGGIRWWWLGILLGFALSCVIEFGQYLFLPNRYATINDVLANTIGATIGVIVAVVIVATRRASSGS